MTSSYVKFMSVVEHQSFLKAFQSQHCSLINILMCCCTPIDGCMKPSGDILTQFSHKIFCLMIDSTLKV